MLQRVHDLWRRLPRGPRRALFDLAVRSAAPRISQAPPDLRPPYLIVGALSAPTGLGEAARLAVLALQQAGERVQILDIGPLTRQVMVPGLVPPAEPAGAESGTALVFANPPVMALALRALGSVRLARKRVVGCWVCEREDIPPNWKKHAAFCHEIAAPSRFAAQAIARGTGRPVRLLPHPVAARPPAGAPRDDSRHGRSALRIGVMGDLVAAASRKNLAGSVTAISAAAARVGRPATLALAARGKVPDDLVRALSAASSLTVEHEAAPLGQAERAAWMHSLDLLVSLHRAEGFGLVPAEAMWAGIPVVATDWSATSEYIDARVGWPIPARLVPAEPELDDPRSLCWADPDPDAAIGAITEALENADLRRAKGREAQARIQALFSAERFTEALQPGAVPIVA